MSDVDICVNYYLSYLDIDGNEDMLKQWYMNRIKILRDEKGWSMQQLADAISPPTTATQVNKLEKGVVQLTESWMRRLSEAFGCSLIEILQEADSLTQKIAALEDRNLDIARGVIEQLYKQQEDDK